MISAAAIVIAMVWSFLPTWDYIDFLKIKKSATLKIPMRTIFSIYALFMIVVALRYAPGDFPSWSLKPNWPTVMRPMSKPSGRSKRMSIELGLCLVTLFVLAGIGMPIGYAIIVGALVYLGCRGPGSGPGGRADPARACTTASSCWPCRCSSSPPIS